MSSALWLLRWAFVLFLAFDQISSPLHKHHHDSGIDGAEIAALHIDTRPAFISDAGYRNGTTFFHATTAVQFNAYPSLPPTGDDMVSTWLYLLDALLALSPETADARPAPTATWTVPPPSLHVSLPPGGRAPPSAHSV